MIRHHNDLLIVGPQLELVKDIGKKKEKRSSYFSMYNKTMNERYAILNCIKNDIKKNQERGPELENGENDRSVATLSLFSEKEDLQVIIAKESKFIVYNFKKVTCFYKLYLYIYNILSPTREFIYYLIIHYLFYDRISTYTHETQK